MGRGELYFDSTDERYFIDLFVTATHNANETAWRRSFEYASQILFDATRGQIQLGRVSFWNNSSSGADPTADIYLQTGFSDCRCDNYHRERTAGQFDLKGRIYLTLRSKIQPMVTVHELGHYACSLLDEYFGTSSQKCVRDASTGASIMEASFNRGIQLDEDGGERASEHQFPYLVNEFCYLNHMSCTSDLSCGFSCSVENDQNLTHGKSCWHTLKEVFTVQDVFTFKFPDDPTHSQGSINPLNWVVRTDVYKIALIILGWEMFLVLEALGELLNFVSTTSSLTSATGKNMYSIEADPASGKFVRNMGMVSREEAAELISELRQLASKGHNLPQVKSELNSLLQLSIGIVQFTGKPGAGQHIIMPVPGDYKLGTGQKKDSASVWNSLNKQLKEKQIRLSIVAFGLGQMVETGKIASQFHSIDFVSILPNKVKPELHGFDYRNYLNQEFMTLTAWGFPAIFDGVLPDLPLPPVDEAQEDEELKLEDRYKKFCRFEPRTEGFDLPVLIEVDAKTVFFGLSEPKTGHIEFTLLAPFGLVINEETDNVKRSIDEEQMTWFMLESCDVELGGQWILRLRRRETGMELPFHLIVAAQSDELSLESTIMKTEGGTLIECVAYYPAPLDFINVLVDIYDASNFYRNSEPIESLVLRRESGRLRDGELAVELSTGRYKKKIQLDVGNYVAVYQVSGLNSVAATNMGGSSIGNLTDREKVKVPSFSRVERKYFSVD